MGGDYSYNDLTAEFKGKEVDLLLNDGREIRGSQIRVQGDSLFGVNPRDRTSFKVAVQEVKRISRTNHFLGGMEGLGAGALGGLVVIAGNRGTGLDDPGFATTVVTALALPAVGLIVGAVVGYTYVYEFPRDSTDTKTD